MTLSDSLARSFFDLHPHAALLIDAGGRVVHANAAAAWLGLDVDGGHTDFAQLTRLAWPASAEDRGALSPGWTRRLRVHAADGSSRQVDADLMAVDGDGPDRPSLHYYCIFRDVTAAVHAARGNQEIESRSKATTDSAPVLIWMADTDMQWDWFNKWWLTYRGRTLGDEVGDGWTEGLHPEDLERCLGIISSSFEEREPFTMDCRLRRHDGVYRWMLATGIPRHGQDGRLLGYIGTCVDITDRKELEDKLAERTRTLRLADRRREDFLAKLSHELRNPLAPIANAAAILRNLEHGDHNLMLVRRIIERQVAQLRRLITDLVDVTGITRGKVVLQRQEVDVGALIAAAAAEVAPAIERNRQVLKVVQPPAGLGCLGDAERLTQALVALLGNAARFSPDGAAILVSTHTGREHLAISIRDSGSGIRPDFLPRVFDLFVQDEKLHGRDDGGLGVGLTIAKRVAELHGGEVLVESAGIGLGTAATLRLPLSAPTAGSDTGDFNLAMLDGRRVLIVEDNADARESLRLLVELGGGDVRTAGDAGDALHLARSFVPEFVVCDIGLPGVDGYELIPALRARLAGQPTRFVALTGYGRVEDRDRALVSGFDAFMVKPLRPAARTDDDPVVGSAA